MLKITIISVGKKHRPELTDAIALYQKRLARFCELNWLLIPESSQGIDGINTEGQAILHKIQSDDTVIALDSVGKNYSSEAFSTVIHDAMVHSGRIVIVIGGAYGLAASVLTRADAVWSLGNATYPHQLVRIIVVEQLYRAFCIQHGLPYHHA